jgi:hypothetical protein
MIFSRRGQNHTCRDTTAERVLLPGRLAWKTVAERDYLRIGIDRFRGFPNNIVTLYGGSFE